MVPRHHRGPELMVWPHVGVMLFMLCRVGVTSEPTVLQRELTEDDKVLVLASDGACALRLTVC
jgi:hypothetical protein